jgi:adenylate cyclase
MPWLTVFLKRGSPKRLEVAIPIVVTLAALLVFLLTTISKNDSATSRFVEKLELQSLDARFHLRGERPHDDNIVIVGLDEQTLQQVGAFPIPRNTYAQMVDRLAQAGAQAIAFDANFPVPEKNSAVEVLNVLESRVPSSDPALRLQIKDMKRTADNDATLAKSLEQAHNVVLGHLFLDPIRATSVSTDKREDYFNILSARPFPQIQKVSKGGDFDLYRAWEGAHGQVARGVYANIRVLAEAAKSFGFFDDEADFDGTFRRATLIIRYADADFYPSLAIQSVREFDHIKDQDVIAFFAENGLERLQIGSHLLHVQRDGHALINYVGPYNSYRHYSMIDVVNGKVPAEAFRGKLVVFGATAVAIGDLRTIPFPDTGYMGVEIHANIIDNILHSGERGRGFLSRGMNEELIDLAFILLFGGGLGYWFLHSKPSIATASAVAALIVFVALIYFAFSQFGMWLSFVIPAGTLFGNYAGITSFRMIFEEREKQRVRNTFKRYVSPGVISLIEQDPKRYFKSGGESKDLSIMFSDIRSFTSLSEGLTPDELVALLNEYLGEMTDLIFKHWGTLDKYIGDAIMAFWGSPFPTPDHAERACAGALELQCRLTELNRKWVCLF